MMNVQSGFALTCPTVPGNPTWLAIGGWNVLSALRFNREALFQVSAKQWLGMSARTTIPVSSGYDHC
ncbi:hypothetical protein [Pseudomonas sp.]|uniref:hypothetical protein n=1 Tax=Pseudomonas sp. TaxID=306 RepID=UPI003F3BC13F